MLDGKDAYKQIRVVPEHVDRTLFMTPDSSMVSHVLQMGDCNGGATYQALMNHIFADCMGVFVDVYLDDIMIYSDTAADHVKHVKLLIDRLFHEKLYLSQGHIIDNAGIAMDPEKVDSIRAWKVPTNRGLLMGFSGAVGYLAPNCEAIRIPMGTLTHLTGLNSFWQWGPTEQRAFEEIKTIVQEFWDCHQGVIDYSSGAPLINLCTDACFSGASGVLSQGQDIHTATIIQFWSAKFSTTQQNYPVHEQELLAIVESPKRFQNLLHGAHF
ncbi:DNA/RNA polymerase [Schizopora paradoxa]|uniref:DNA/RNA polymerase n=1 Tax=Schizopora paradoxa TaxID=27342 RepID=A0A0H2QWK0_9AGAM|nr:DNA/RNA polymerase [Schizopora paradoxa]